MEKWKVAYNDMPKGRYQTTLSNGEENGLNIKLENDEYVIELDFGVVQGLRMLEEGTLLQDKTFNDKEILKYKEDNFLEIVYLIEEGQFKNFIKENMGDVVDILDLKHYIIITMNYVIEVISQWELEVSVSKIN
ncbi:MAG: hypothetical protein ACRCWM_05070 [Sarcina sp.]